MEDFVCDLAPAGLAYHGLTGILRAKASLSAGHSGKQGHRIGDNKSRPGGTADCGRFLPQARFAQRQHCVTGGDD